MTLFFGGLMRKIITNNKPTRFDGHLVYTCQECATESFVTLQEALTEGFIVVCPECNAVLKLKPIKEIRVDFVEDQAKQNKQVDIPEPPPPPPVPNKKPVDGSGDLKLQDLTSEDVVVELEDKHKASTLIPDNAYDDLPEKFKQDKAESSFVIQEIPDELMPVLESVVSTLKKYGYGHDEAAKLTYSMCRSDVNRKWTARDLAAEILKQEKEVIIHVK